MVWNLPTLLPFLCYGFLYLTVLSLWIPSRKNLSLWIPLLIISIVFGLIGHFLEMTGLVSLIIFSCLLYGSNNLSSFLSILCAFGVFILGLGFYLHWVPGFHNLNVLRSVFISPDALPYSLYLNLDKTSVGILIVGLTGLMIKQGNWISSLKKTFPRALLIIAIIAALSVFIGYIRFDPKIPENLGIWIITNLLFVCFAEEAFFRGFVQRRISLFLTHKKYGNAIAILIGAIAFGALHYTGGILYILLATIAGIGYGWIYDKTKSLESSILTHFSLNLIHILFFTYPALKTAF